MAIRVHLHPWLDDAGGGQKTVEVAGATIRECVDRIGAQYPNVRKRILNQEGEVKSYVVICRNGRNTYPAELSEPVEDGDEISFLFLIDGG